MKGNFKSTSALTLLDSVTLATPDRAEMQKWQTVVAAQINEIARAERMTPRRAIAVGLMLHAVKSSLKHGEFTPWMKQMLTQLTFWTEGTAKVNASYYMRLAITFVETSKATKEELLSLSAVSAATGLDLANVKGEAAKLVKRLDSFCGEATLAELLADHGIKSGGSGSSSGKVIEIPASAGDPLLADTAAHLVGLREIILNPETLKRFTAKQLADLEQQVASLPQEFRKLLAKIRD